MEKCNHPPNASPITYQLFLDSENDPFAYTPMIPLTVPQLSSVIFFPGTPIPSFSENQLSRLIVKTCDSFQTCTIHRSRSIRIEKSIDLDKSIQQLIYHAKRLSQTGDLIVAISYLNVIFLKSNFDEQNHQLYEEAINATIEYATSAIQIPNLPLGIGHYELITSACSHALHQTRNVRLRSRLLNIINRYLDKSEALNSRPSIRNIQIIYQKVMNSFVDNFDRQYFRDVRATFERIKKIAATRIPLGHRLVLDAYNEIQTRSEFEEISFNHDSRIHSARTEFIHHENVEDILLRADSYSNLTILAKVQFGEEIRQTLNRTWQCRNQMDCTANESSVVQCVTIFPDENPFPIDHSSVYRLSPIIDISIHSPRDGNQRKIRGMFKASVFEISITGNESYGDSSYSTRCHYFDEEKEQWLTDDIHSLGIAYNQAACWTGHLTSFVVMRSKASLSIDYIITVLVATTMGILVFAMMIVFYSQRKRKANQSRASLMNEKDHKNSSRSSSINHDDGDEHHLNNQQHSSSSTTDAKHHHHKANNHKVQRRINSQKLKLENDSIEIQSKTILVDD